MNLISTHRFGGKILLFVAAFWLAACSDDDVNPVTPPAAQEGYFIINEGGFGNANTSLSFYDRSRDTVLNNVFENANGRPLGDQAQSMTVFDTLAFVVVQNSAKIEVIDPSDFTSIATIIDGITSPRYLLGLNNTKAYVTDWGADGITGTVKVIDLNTYQVTQTIPVGQGPNQLVLWEGRVYVANGGGYGRDSTLMVIDPATDAVVDTVVVGDNPSSLVVDAENDLWVAGGGYISYAEDFSVVEEESTPGFLAELKGGAVSQRLDAARIGVGPSDVTANLRDAALCFQYQDGVYTMPSTATAWPDQPLIDQRFYGVAIDPVSGEILTGEAPNFSAEGTFHRYASTGELIKSYTVGIAPNGFAF